jgi:hypothetical protein
MATDLQILRDKLAELAAKDFDCLYFGVETHRYRLAQCLTPDEVTAIERHYAIELPEDYRAFITDLGNGGAGPGYGLERFGFVRSAQEIPTATATGTYREVKRTHHGTLSRQDLIDAEGQVVDPMEIAFYTSILGRSGEGQAWPSLAFPCQSLDDEWDEERDDNSAGNWILAEYGCAMSARLVLNGPLRGQVWFDAANGALIPFSAIANIHYADEDEVLPEDRDVTFSFMRWYEHWLDHALRQVGSEYED